nr:MAG TPA: hypothetical protein [Bacteriophage sp.]
MRQYRRRNPEMTSAEAYAASRLENIRANTTATPSTY